MPAKIESGYYIAEAPATGNSMEDSRYMVFQWTEEEVQTVELARRQMKPLERDGRWYSLQAGPGPRVQVLNELPEWVDEVEGMREKIDGGSVSAIDRDTAERLLAIEDRTATKVDCVHLTITSDEVYVGAYGKHCDTHWETREFSAGNGVTPCCTEPWRVPEGERGKEEQVG